MLRLHLLVLFLLLAIVLACLSPSNSGGYTPAGASTTSSNKSIAEVLHHISALQRSLLSKKALHEATVSTADQGAVVIPPQQVLVPPSAPNPYILASTTSQSAAIGHSMSPPRRLLNKVSHVPPSALNPGTYIPASTRSQSAAIGHNMLPPRRSLKTAPDVPAASTTKQSAFMEPLRCSLKNELVPPSAAKPGMHTNTDGFLNLSSKCRSYQSSTWMSSMVISTGTIVFMLSKRIMKCN